jgi:hypothetical protein
MILLIAAIMGGLLLTRLTNGGHRSGSRNYSETRRPPSHLLTAIIHSTFWLWQRRLELTLTLTYGVYAYAALSIPTRIAALAGLVLLAATITIIPPLLHHLHAANVRREWTRAVIDAGAADPPAKRSRRPPTFFGPRCGKVDQVLAGDILHVTVGRGTTVSQLTSHDKTIARNLHARDIRITPEPEDPHARAKVLVLRRDPFTATGTIRWPHADAATLSLWDPIPMGIDSNGDTVHIALPERNLLIGGEPGAGKSVAINLIAATAALDPNVHIWLLDGKRVDLKPWKAAAHRYVNDDVPAALKLLTELQDEMTARYHWLDSQPGSVVKVERQHALPLHLLIVDELPYYLQQGGSDKQRKQLAELLRDLISRGRAAGIIDIAAAQKPSADIVPTVFRDLFGLRLALRCNTPQASDTILGQGWAAADHDASTIPGVPRGVGELLAEGERPVRERGFYLAADDVTAIAERGARQRADALRMPELAGDPEPPAKPESDPGPRGAPERLRRRS